MKSSYLPVIIPDCLGQRKSHLMNNQKNCWLRVSLSINCVSAFFFVRDVLHGPPRTRDALSILKFSPAGIVQPDPLSARLVKRHIHIIGFCPSLSNSFNSFLNCWAHLFRVVDKPIFKGQRVILWNIQYPACKPQTTRSNHPYNLFATRRPLPFSPVASSSRLCS